MPQFRVKLRRVVYAEVVVDASSATAARHLVSEDAAAYFVQSNPIGSDTVSISSVEVELQPGEKRRRLFAKQRRQFAKQLAAVEAITAELLARGNPDPDRLELLRQQKSDLEYAITVVRDNAHN
jgi:hypothetical protein